MTCYRVSGFVFASVLRFPELTPVGTRRAAATLAVTRVALAPARPSWYHRWKTPGRPDWLRFARVGSGYLLRFPGLADFLVSSDSRRVRCRPGSGVPAGSIRHLFLHQVLPLVMSQQRRLVLHASAVVTPAGAVAFLGASHRGKSTLAAAFWAAGCPLVTDDCLCLDLRAGVARAVPGYPGLRLWPDTMRGLALGGIGPTRQAAGGDKVRVGFEWGSGGFARRPVRLARLYLLAATARSGQPRDVRIESLSGRETLVAIIAHLYRLDVGRRSVLRQDFDRLARLARRLPARRLHVPRGFARLQEVMRAIYAEIGAPARVPGA